MRGAMGTFDLVPLLSLLFFGASVGFPTIEVGDDIPAQSKSEPGASAWSK